MRWRTFSKLAPATTNIVVVIGATPLEQFWTDALRQEFEPFTNRVSFTWLNELSFDQMLERSAKLPPRSFMLFILLLRDATGVTHNADDALRRIHEVANAPVNGIFQHQLGMGIVGGRLYQAELEGVESARIAVRILHGEPASNFPPRLWGRCRPRYDWRELQRWNISEDRLPPGSTVLFREPSFWEHYWRPITGTILFCLLQAALIVSLLINRAKRRRGEAEAALIAEISSKFVNLPPGEVDREIVDAQRRIFELLDLDVSGFWQWSADASGFFRLTHYSRAGEGPQISRADELSGIFSLVPTASAGWPHHCRSFDDRAAAGGCARPGNLPPIRLQVEFDHSALGGRGAAHRRPGL